MGRRGGLVVVQRSEGSQYIARVERETHELSHQYNFAHVCTVRAVSARTSPLQFHS